MHSKIEPQVEAGYDDPDKSNLFFKLHQLQTGSWGASSIGRITQVRTDRKAAHAGRTGRFSAARFGIRPLRISCAHKL